MTQFFIYFCVGFTIGTLVRWFIGLFHIPKGKYCINCTYGMWNPAATEMWCGDLFGTDNKAGDRVKTTDTCKNFEPWDKRKNFEMWEKQRLKK